MSLEKDGLNLYGNQRLSKSKSLDHDHLVDPDPTLSQTPFPGNASTILICKAPVTVHIGLPPSLNKPKHGDNRG